MEFPSPWDSHLDMVPALISLLDGLLNMKLR